MAQNKLQKLLITIAIVLIVIIVLYVVFKPFVIIDAGEAGVVFNAITGVEHRILKPGMNLLIPIIQRPIIYNVQTQTYTASGSTTEGDRPTADSIQAQTSDGQPVWLDISVLYHLDMDNLWKLHSEIGKNYTEKIIRPTVRNIIRLIVSKYTVIELYSSNPVDIANALKLPPDSLKGQIVGRLKVQNDMDKELRDELGKHYIVVEKVLIRNVKFTEEYQQAIERKQVAQQDAERMKYILEKTQKEKEQKIIEAEGIAQSKIIQAQGEAKAISLIGETLKKYPSYIQYNYVEKLSPNIKAIISDQKSILNFGDFLSK